MQHTINVSKVHLHGELAVASYLAPADVAALNSSSILEGSVLEDHLLNAEALAAEGTAALIGEPSSGYALPEADVYARRLADQAYGWLQHACERSRMKEDGLVQKALASLAFSLRHRCKGFGVPSKLIGTSKAQPALWRLVQQRVPFGTALDVEEVREGDSKRQRVRLVVSHAGEVLGEVQPKHVPWLRPLIPFGAGLYLARVSGNEGSFTLGCNVILGGVGAAIEALHHALGHDLEVVPGSESGHSGSGGDGVSAGTVELDGLEPVAPFAQSALPPRNVSSAQGGDGAAGVAPGGPSDAEEDVRFWRDTRGRLRMNVPHVVKHSLTGPEIGYLGSGPADAALSVLSAVTSRDEAERWYQLYKADVVQHLDPAGATLTRASVRAWLATQNGSSPAG